MNIKLTLHKPTIIEAVKNETFHKGQFDKAVDQKAIVAAYHEQAGDETYHERILERTFFTSLAEAKTLLYDYLTENGQMAADNIAESSEGSNIVLVLNVPERFNTSYTDPLAKLVSEYVVNAMLMDWWRPVNDKQSALYATFLERNVTAIKRCFSKTAPAVPKYAYPKRIILRYPLIEDNEVVPGVLSHDNDGSVNPHMLYANPWCISVGQESEISYTLEGEDGQDPLDDIMIRCDNICCQPGISPNGGWYVKGVSTGFTIITLQSAHNDQVYAKFAIRVV